MAKYALPGSSTPKTQAPAPPAPDATQSAAEPQAPQAPATQAPAAPVPSWAKTGAAARAQMDAQRERDAQKKAERSGMWRFWLRAGEKARITFLDGRMGTFGGETALEPPLAYKEHELKVGKDFPKYVCLEDHEGHCPICESGDEPVSVWAFTVIDHREFPKKKNGQPTGEVRKDQKKLFIAKARTAGQLSEIAKKYGGLQGLTLDVTRTDDRVARVGDMFLPDEKLTGKQIMERYANEDNKLADPTDYGKELPFYTTDQLVKLGVVAAPGAGAIGGHGAPSPGGTPGEDVPF